MSGSLVGLVCKNVLGECRERAAPSKNNTLRPNRGDELRDEVLDLFIDELFCYAGDLYQKQKPMILFIAAAMKNR